MTSVPQPPPLSARIRRAIGYAVGALLLWWGIQAVLPLVTRDALADTFETATRRVKLNLRDPESARFRFVRAYRGTTGNDSAVVTICGYVNAKNAFGGYAGEAKFLWNERRGTLLQDVTSYETMIPFDSIAAIVCTGETLGYMHAKP